MNSEYVIINKTLLEKRIEELIKEANSGKTIPSVNSQMAESLIKFKEYLLSQSTPLIPEIDAAFGTGARTAKELIEKYNYATSAPIQDAKMEYISNLKLDI